MSSASICRPAVGERACGDAFQIYTLEDSWLLLVVDGLGHGPDAETASQKAVRYVTEVLSHEPTATIERLMRGCHKELAGTRGAAVGFCRLAPDAGRLRFCGVGNIAMSVFPERRGLGISIPGVVGYRMRKVRVFESDIGAHDLVAVYSDGISSRFSLKSYAKLPLDDLVQQIEGDHGKDHDDATIVAVRVADAVSP